MFRSTLSRLLMAGLALSFAWREATAQSEFVRMLPKLPESTNAIALVDLKSMFNSPIALKEKWAENESETPLFPPRLASRSDYLVYGSALNFGGGFDRNWEIVLAETKASITAKEVAVIVGGAVDELAGTSIVWDPRDSFIVLFDEQMVGARFPADRQETGRWIKEAQKAGTESRLSPYLRHVAAMKQTYDHQLVMAFDTADLFTPALMRPILASSPAFDLKLDDLDAASRALASAEGVLLGIKADTGLEGIVKVDFGMSTAPLKRIAKPLLIDMLQRIGADLRDLRDWRTTIEEDSITIQGPLTTSGARRMASLLELDPGLSGPAAQPEPEVAQSPAPAAGESASPGAVAPTLKATEKYYRDLMTLLDDIRDEDKTKTQRTISLWCGRYATKIDRMPILRVDPDLLAFSRKITITLRDLSNTAKGANMNIVARQTTDAATSTGGGYYGGGYYGFGYGPYLEGTSRIAMERITKQEGLKASSYEIQVWAQVEQELNDLDRVLTMRYGVEF